VGAGRLHQRTDHAGVVLPPVTSTRRASRSGCCSIQSSSAPMSNAEKIRKPLFVVQGKNDPRVPYTESEQIVAKVRANGQPVWYLRGENEGHGFVRKENVDFMFYAMVKFVEQHLLA